MSTDVKEKLRQRPDYTHKFNSKTGRHGWLRLTPAYSVKMVEELMGRYTRPLRLLDPFCGTATTALSGAYRGHDAVTTDINPFLVWFGRAKTAQYTDASIASTLAACARVLQDVKRGRVRPVQAPPVHNIERWWSPDGLDFLCMLSGAIEAESTADSVERTLLSVAFCRTLIQLSSAAFNHQSMSFRNDRQLRIPIEKDADQVFHENLHFVLEGAQENPKGMGRVVLGDARTISDAVDGSFDLVITSPPYANRMSYIRELRPYMYWLGFLASGRDAGELDWSAIGGTWGLATSRLTDWCRPPQSFTHPVLEAALEGISRSGNKNGKILANYVAKYVDDMWKHFRSLVPLLRAGSELHYIVGNSTFYGVLLSVERLYVAMLDRLGFEDVECKAIRKRNSKAELFEFDVTARWTS